jgi:predicted membrane protein
MVTPNFSSAMSGFGYIYVVFLTLVAAELWFIHRGDLIARAEAGGIIGLACRVGLLFNLEQSEQTRAADRKLVKFLGGIGVPLSCILTGYVGFLFGTLKANPWWSTPMMFIIFVLSAIVSGTAVMIVLYFFISTVRRWGIDEPCARILTKILWAAMIIAVSLELLEIISSAYKSTEEWEYVYKLITEHLFVTFVVLQFGVCSVGPFLLLGVSSLFNLSRRLSYLLIWLAAGLLLIQVFLMRWNVVIGGQTMSKSYRGFTEYHIRFFEKEGIITAVVIFTVPFLLLVVFNRVIRLFPRPGQPKFR